MLLICLYDNSQRDNAKKGDLYMFSTLLADVIADWQGKIISAVDKILVPILIIGCSVGLIYAVVIGIKMMKADKKEEREENKSRLINIAISIVAVVVLIGLFYALRSWLLDNQDTVDSDFGSIWESAHIGGNLSNTLSLVKQCVSMWL